MASDSGNRRTRVSEMVSVVTPVATQPTRVPSSSTTGTIVRTDGPSVPRNSSVSTRGVDGTVPRYGAPI